MVHKIERESEEMKALTQKKDPYFPINEAEANIQDYLKVQDYGADMNSSEVVVTKDDFFIQIRNKIDLLKSEKKRLI